MRNNLKILPLAIAGSLAMTTALPVVSASYHDNGIVGSIVIDFNSRKGPGGEPRPGITDKYAVNLNVGKDSAFNGEIIRTPQIAGAVGIRQPANMRYELDLIVHNPSDRSQTISVGRWVGDMPINSSGLYQLNKNQGSSMRYAITMRGGASSGDFKGTIQGRELGKGRLLQAAQQMTESVRKEGATKVFTRMYQGQPMSVQVTNIDPMRFNSVVMPAGPAAMYSEVTVNGDMVFDYDSDTWFLDGMTFRYQDEGKAVTDKVAGTIRWIDSEDGGRYELNITFNEPDVAPGAATDASGFFAANDASAAGFFAVDDSVASCGGQVLFSDEYGSGEMPIRSTVNHQIECNSEVTAQQLMAFSKLWLLGIGPLTDE